MSTHVAIRAAGGEGVHRHRRGGDLLRRMEEATYTFGGAAKILDIAESKLRYWAQVGFVGPSARRGGKPVFTFQDLVSVKAAKELVDRGFKAGRDPQGARRRARVAAAPRPAAGPHPRRVRRHQARDRRRRQRLRDRAARRCSTSGSATWRARSAPPPAAADARSRWRRGGGGGAARAARCKPAAQGRR